MGPARHSATEFWDEFRGQMPVSRRWAYFDHAAVSPLPADTQKAITRWLEQVSAEGDVVWSEWANHLEDVRKLFAQLLGAERDEIALVANTTTGINIVSQGIRWQPGDNVVTLADEFPTNQYPWLVLARRGVEVRRVPTERGEVDLSRLAAACDRRTRLLTISWVGYASGWRNELEAAAEIARRCGAKLLVDAIQALGVFPLDVHRIPLDFLAADGHKWLLGPEGAGVFYVRRELLDWLDPVGVGWNSVVGATDFSRIDLQLKPSAERYEGGSMNMAGFIGLKSSLELLLGIGTARLAERIVHLTDLACERLRSLGATVISNRQPQHKSGIVSFELPGIDLRTARQDCLQRGVVLSCRGGRLRISPHAYNNADDIDRLVEALEQLRRRQPNR